MKERVSGGAGETPTPQNTILIEIYSSKIPNSW
jgi:hypothetical protein